MNAARSAALFLLVSTTAIAQGDGARKCSAAEPASIEGSVLDARNGVGLEKASVAVDWDELTVYHGTLKTTHHEAKTSAAKSGEFRLCDLPTESPLMLRVSSEGFREVQTELALPADGMLQRTFRLSDDRSTTGTATLRARVVDDTGGAMTIGRATILALGRRVSIDSGRIAFAGLPPGTWVVDLRAIGYERAVVLLDTDDPKTIRMDRVVHTLDPVTVIDKANTANRKILNEIAQRMRSAFGTVILADNLSMRNAMQASDPIAVTRGFSYKGNDQYAARPYASGFGLRGCGSPESIPLGQKGIAVYLDGVRVLSGLRAINELVPPKDLLAIETYPDVMTAPFLWRTHDACAVVAFWTKR